MSPSTQHDGFCLRWRVLYGVDRQTAQAIGSWQDTPGDSKEAMPAQRVMSVHYSDVKALASGQAKARVLDAFVKACSHHPAVRSIMSGTPAHVPPGTLTWGTVSHAHMQREAQSSNAASSSQGAVVMDNDSPEGKSSKDKAGKERKDKRPKRRVTSSLQRRRVWTST